MDTQKIKELLYDAQRSTHAEAHDLIMKYATDYVQKNNKSDRVEVDYFAVETIYKGKTEATVRVSLTVPLNMMQDKTFTFKNILT